MLGLHLDDRLLHLLLAIKNLLCIFLTFLKDFLQLSFFFDLKLCDQALQINDGLIFLGQLLLIENIRSVLLRFMLQKLLLNLLRRLHLTLVLNGLLRKTF